MSKGSDAGVQGHVLASRGKSGRGTAWVQGVPSSSRFPGLLFTLGAIQWETWAVCNIDWESAEMQCWLLLQQSASLGHCVPPSKHVNQGEGEKGVDHNIGLFFLHMAVSWCMQCASRQCSVVGSNQHIFAEWHCLMFKPNLQG